MTLLMDTPYLEQLKLSSARLQDMIPATNPFATYTMGAETAPPTIQGVPQNYFDPMTGQFMMPNLQFPETTSTDASIPASFGTYTPAPFGVSATNEVTPGLMSDAMTGDRGSNSPNQQGNPRYSYESLNGRTFRVDNVTGEVEEANMPLGTASLFGTFANAIPGVQNYRLANMTPEQRQALEMANAIAINRAAGFNPQNPATTDAVEATGSGAVGSTGPTSRSGSDKRGNVGDRNAPGGSAAAGANRGGAAGARS